MLIDGKQRQDDWFRDIIFDVCICGAGPAGITLARTLASKGRRVALMEAGGHDISQESQALYEGQIVGLPYSSLDTCRLRYLGGTSNHWEGYTRPLDARDFEALPHHPLQEWPIRRQDLDSYAKQAAKILDLARQQWPTDLFSGKRHSLKPATTRESLPTRFGTKYIAELAKSDLISLCLNANLVDIRLDSSLRSVSELVFRSYVGEEPFLLRARYVVVCCGGLENARILLNANSQMSSGIGNQHDLVGRFFCEHPEIKLGHAVMETPPLEPSDYIAGDQLILDRRCLSFLVGVEPLPLDGHGVPACARPFTERLSQAFLKRTHGCFDVEVEAVTTQALNYDSRVKLSDTKDRFGLRRLALDWRLTDLDKHTITTAALEMGRSMAEYNVGRMQLVPWLLDPSGLIPLEAVKEGCHHMCTTRMSDDPKLGVVDKNCRVHGIENLFIGGSSVFASGGVSHPTYTIIQLALRLGDYLETRLG